MKNNRFRKKISIIATISIIYFSISYYITPTYAIDQSSEATVKASIPSKANIKVYGFASPNSLIQVTGIRIFAQVSSDQNGYFIIDPLYISSEAKEICLSVLDSVKRVGFPLCIGLPDIKDSLEIGPLMLSPTLSLSEGRFWQGQEGMALGSTIPNTPVQIYLFEVQTSNVASIISRKFTKIFNPQVWAVELPLIETVSGNDGVFSINIPTNRSVAIRIHARAVMKNFPSPKSVTLSFLIGSSFAHFQIFLLPKLFLFFWICFGMIYLLLLERKTHRIRTSFVLINEKRLKPIAVKLHLRLVRLIYNFRDWLRSRQR